MSCPAVYCIKQRKAHGKLVIAFWSKTFPYDFQQNLAEMVDSSANWLQNSKKACKLLLRHHDPLVSCNLLRSFLILWKQLEILKAEWGRLKLRTEDVNTVPLYKVLWAIWVSYLGCKNIPEWLKRWKMRKVSAFSIHFPPVPLFHFPFPFFVFYFYLPLFLLIINLVLSLFSKGLRTTFCFFVSVWLFFPLSQCLFRLFADDIFQVHSSQSCDPPLFQAS